MKPPIEAVSFDASAQSFLSSVYGRKSGMIRREHLTEDLEGVIRENPWIRSILDIGSGHAPVTLELLKRHPGLRARLVDPSRKLLAKARATRRRAGVGRSRLRTTVGDLSTVSAESGRFPSDLIICHAVANWTPDPGRFINELIQLAAEDDAAVSLVVGASIGKALRFAREGRLNQVSRVALKPGSLVPSLVGDENVRPLDPEAVVRRINRAGCRIILRAGVNILSDIVPPEVLSDSRRLRRLKEVEASLRTESRYWRLGQLVHIVFHAEVPRIGGTLAALHGKDNRSRKGHSRGRLRRHTNAALGAAPLAQRTTSESHR